MLVSRAIRWGLGPAMLLAALTTCGGPSEPDLEGAGRLVWGGLSRGFILRLPEGYTTTRTWPMLIAFHGGGGTGLGFEATTNFTSLADSAGVIVVYPYGYQGSWAVGCDCTTADVAQIDDVGFIRTLIRQLGDTLAVDPNRVFVAGFSQGARFVQRLACELADVISGVASIEGTLHSLVAADCEPARPLPVLLMLATADPAVAWEGHATTSGRYYSAEETVQFWVAQESCDTTPTQTLLANTTDDGTVVRLDQYTGCAGGDVAFYTIQDGGHAWPGSSGSWPAANGAVCQDISASREILAFMARYAPS